jgi:DNA adenine methylase
MTDADHRALAQSLRAVQGKAAISGYPCDLMDELYGDWHCTLAPSKYAHSIKQLRTEALWTNYDPAETSCSDQQMTFLR